MTNSDERAWYWCLDHGQVETSAEGCPPEVRMGPYASAEEARNWRQKVENRNDKWDAEDRAWTGEDPDR